MQASSKPKPIPLTAISDAAIDTWVAMLEEEEQKRDDAYEAAKLKLTEMCLCQAKKLKKGAAALALLGKCHASFDVSCRNKKGYITLCSENEDVDGRYDLKCTPAMTRSLLKWKEKQDELFDDWHSRRRRRRYNHHRPSAVREFVRRKLRECPESGAKIRAVLEELMKEEVAS